MPPDDDDEYIASIEEALERGFSVEEDVDNTILKRREQTRSDITFILVLAFVVISCWFSWAIVYAGIYQPTTQNLQNILEASEKVLSRLLPIMTLILGYYFATSKK